MPRLSENDAERVAELSHFLGTWRLGDPPVLAGLMPQLLELLGAEKTVTYGIAHRGHGLAFSFLFGAGFSIPLSEVLRVSNDFLWDKTVGWAAYNALRPEPHQRNVAVAFRQLNRIVAPESTPFAQHVFPRVGLDHRDQLRVLICDGPSLLAWVGGFRPEEFAEREHQMLGRLIPAFRQRLKLERQLGESRVAAAALPAAMEAISSAAFIVASSGAVKHANSAGAQLMECNRETTGWIRQSLANPDSGKFSTTKLDVGGAPEHHLAVMRRPLHDAAPHVAQSTERWQLSKKQTAVLDWLVRGAANKTIATALGCAEGTVELHVTRLMAKAQVESRAALVAKFWLNE